MMERKLSNICFAALSKIKISNMSWRKNLQINRRMRGGGTKYQPQRSGVCILWGRRLRGFTVSKYVQALSNEKKMFVHGGKKKVKS